MSCAGIEGITILIGGAIMGLVTGLAIAAFMKAQEKIKQIEEAKLIGKIVEKLKTKKVKK